MKTKKKIIKSVEGLIKKEKKKGLLYTN